MKKYEHICPYCNSHIADSLAADESGTDFECPMCSRISTFDIEG